MGMFTVELSEEGKWPCCFFPSDTTGEKDFEEFYTEGEEVDIERFVTLGIVKNSSQVDNALLESFLTVIREMKCRDSWDKKDIVDLFFKMIPDFGHKETGKYLDSKM